MSTHVRLVLQQGGHFYAGPNVVKCLSDYVPNFIGPRTTEQIINTVIKLRAEGFKMTLWLLREPRCLPMAKSRYKQLCKMYKMRKKVNQGADPQGFGGVVANLHDLLLHQQVPLPAPPQGAWPPQQVYLQGAANGQYHIQGQAVAPRGANHPHQ